jgi:predicted HAD superfamily phosphohydrolase YqeG
MKPDYERLADMDEVVRRATQLSVRTMVFDIEPLVAYWNSTQYELDQGVRTVLRQVEPIPGLRIVCFATNSARRLSAIPESPDVRVTYLAAAGKPLRTAPYQGFPSPGVVIGDQILTDGLLARRLGYTFFDLAPPLKSIPLGPQLLNRSGRLLRPLLFARSRW